MTRRASDVGRGLAPARAPRPIVPGERIHVIGIAGAGASAAALLARARGALVDGCDAGGPSPYTPALDAAGITFATGHDAAHVTRGSAPARLAVSKALTAVAPDHPELQAARERGIPLEPWQQVVADAAAGAELVAVAGTHGKSTTTGWLTHLLAGAGLDPSAFVGALLPASLTGGTAATARIGSDALLVVEADEYAGNFDPYRPSIAAITGVEWDHPDVFADLDAVVAAFDRWLRSPGAEARRLVLNVGDPGARALLDLLGDWPGTVLPVEVLGEDGAGHGAWVGPPAREPGLVARILAATPVGTRVEISGLPGAAGPVVADLTTAGRHNVVDGLVAAGTAAALGVSADAIRRGLESFAGVGRRLERKGEVAGVVVYDDYGHHPTAIRETLAAVRQREPGRRLWAVCEPLTFHRTRALLGGFAAVLATADRVAIADIWAGRDTPEDRASVSAADLASAVRAVRPESAAEATGSPEATADRLAALVEAGDAVLVMGGGRSYRIGERLLERLRERLSEPEPAEGPGARVRRPRKG